MLKPPLTSVLNKKYFFYSKAFFSIQDYAIFNQLFNKLIVFLQFCIAMNNIEHVCQCVMTVPHEFSFYEDRTVLTVVEFQSLYFIVVFIEQDCISMVLYYFSK